MIQRALALVRDEIEQAIDRAEVVSFSVFGTLVWRAYETPADLFKHIELGSETGNFAALRSRAEHRAREKARLTGLGKVTLDDIYENMPPAMQRLRAVEIQQELLACRRDEFIFDIFQYALDQGKRVVLASDTPLPHEVVEKIVGAAGYERYERLFSSSRARNSRAAGAIFVDISDFAGVARQRILHIGNDHHSDHLIPLEIGLSAYHYVSALEIAGDMADPALFKHLAREPYASSPAISLTKRMIAHYNALNPAADYWEKFGFTYGGLIACGFASWIKEQCEENDVSRIFFLARDGFLFREVFERMYPGKHAGYLYASRRCYMMAALEEVDGAFLSLTVNDIFISGNHAPWTYENFIEQLALEAPDLRRAYVDRFPEQKTLVTTAEQLDEIRSFFRAHREELVAEGARERRVLMRYFRRAGLLGGNVGLVDLGWKGTLIKSLTKICRLENVDLAARGLYFGTHRHDASGARIASYALHHGMPEESVLNRPTAVILLEMMFSAPHGSIIKVAEHGTGFSPLHQNDDGSEAERVAVFGRMRDGVLRFVDEFLGVTSGLPMPIPGPVSVGPLDALCNNIGPADQAQFARLSYTPGVGDVQNREPVCPRVGEKRFAIILPRPGSRCAEAESVLRIVRAAESIGVQPVLISREGYLLNRLLEQTGDVVDARTLDFAISLHYDLPKLLDTFCYLALLDPPEASTGGASYARSAENYVTFDDYLGAGSKRIESHLRSVLDNSPRQVDGMSELCLSFPLDALMPPNLLTPRVFHRGTAWEEALLRGGDGHEDLLRLLDKTSRMRVFGPDEAAPPCGNRHPDGSRARQGSFPPDSLSVVREINACGIALVVSSDSHRRSGMAPARLYEACAAGAVIIADDNPFVREHFGDAALFIDYDASDPAGTLRQILERHDWIVANPRDALALARRAQAVFRDRFALEPQLRLILDRHDGRKEAVARALYARENDPVLAIHVIDRPFFCHTEKAALHSVLRNIARQSYGRMVLAVACDASVQDAVRLFCLTKVRDLSVDVLPYDLFDRKGTRVIPGGRVVRDIARKIDHAYVILAARDEVWYADHVTTLKRVLEDDPDAVAAHSGKASAEPDGSRSLSSFGPLQISGLFECTGVSPGEVLFRREVEDYLGPHLYEFLDGLEHYAFLLMAEFRERKRIVFSKRISFAVAAHPADRAEPAFRLSSQVRFIQDLVHYEYELRRSRSLQPLPVVDATPHPGADAGSIAAQAVELRVELAARTDELVRTRTELVTRTNDLVAVRDRLTERTKIAEQLQKDLIERTGMAEQLRANLIERTGVAEELQANLIERTGVAEQLQANLIERTGVAEQLRADLADRTSTVERLLVDLHERTEALAESRELLARTERRWTWRRRLTF